MKTLFTALILFTFISSASAITPCSDMVLNGVFPISKGKVEIICHKRFVIGFSPERKAPLWVAEKLTAESVNAIKFKRRNAFKPDPLIDPSKQSTLEDFIGNEYDKGHMVPNEDVGDDSTASFESFYLTNMVPQIADNNRGIWKAVEMRTRKMAASKKYVFVITGPIFNDKPAKLKSGVHIPSKLFKVIISPFTHEVLTIIVPNETGIQTASMPKYFSTLNVLGGSILGFNPIPGKNQLIELTDFNFD